MMEAVRSGSCERVYFYCREPRLKEYGSRVRVTSAGDGVRKRRISPTCCGVRFGGPRFHKEGMSRAVSIDFRRVPLEIRRRRSRVHAEARSAMPPGRPLAFPGQASGFRRPLSFEHSAQRSEKSVLRSSSEANNETTASAWCALHQDVSGREALSSPVQDRGEPVLREGPGNPQ